MPPATRPVWKIYVRDPNRQRIAEVDDFEKLEISLKFNSVGAWILDVPLSAAGPLSFTNGIVVTRDDRTIISGPITRLQRTWNGNKDALTASGPSDTIWLQRRLAYPVPTGPPYASDSHDVRTGPAETVMLEYVLANAGVGSGARAIGGLLETSSSGLGSVVTGRARFENLLELLTSLALAGGDLGFDLVQIGSDLQFIVYQPKDRSGQVVFSPSLGNLTDFEYVAEAADGNYIIAGGGGEATARVFEENQDAVSVAKYGRIEMFRDRRDTSDVTELQQTITEELALHSERGGLKLSPVDTPSQGFMTHYGLGDRVSVMVDGVPFQDVIREVRLSLDSKGEAVIPTVGTPGTSNTLQVFDSLGRAKSRISQLERR